MKHHQNKFWMIFIFKYLGLVSRKWFESSSCFYFLFKFWIDLEVVVLRCYVKKGILGKFAKFTGKHLCKSLFFNKVAGLRPKASNFIKKETLAQVFSCKLCEISKNTFFTEHLLATASVLNTLLRLRGRFYLKHLNAVDF